MYDYTIAKSKLLNPEITQRPPDPFHIIRRREVYAVSGSADSKQEEVGGSKRRRKSYRGGKRIKLKSLNEETKELIGLYMNKFCTEERSSGDTDN